MRRSIAFLALLLLAPLVVAQGTKADYERASSVYKWTARKVTSARVEPNWTADGNRFWYRNANKEYVLVDAVKGTRRLVSEKELPKDAKPIPPKKKRRREEVGLSGPTLLPPFPAGKGEPAASQFDDAAFYRDTTALPMSFSPLPAGRGVGGVGRKSETNPGALGSFPPVPLPTERVGRESAAQPPFRRGQSPDGNWVAFIRENNVWLRDTKTKEETQLSKDGKEGDSYGRMIWSPDSKRLIAIRTKAGGDRKVTLVESSPRDQLQPNLHLRLPQAGRPDPALEAPPLRHREQEGNRRVRRAVPQSRGASRNRTGRPTRSASTSSTTSAATRSCACSRSTRQPARSRRSSTRSARRSSTTTASSTSTTSMTRTRSSG